MKIEMSMTDKDKKLLIALIVILLLTAFGFLGIKPLTVRYLESKQNLEDEMKVKEIVDKKQLLYDSLQEYSNTLEKQVKEETKDYYPIMESNDVDKLLTGIVLKENLASRNLVITMPDEDCTLEPYAYSQKAQNKSSKENTGDLISAESTFTVGDVTVDSSADDAQDGEKEGSTGVYAVDVSMTVTGSEENIKKLIDNLSRNYPAIRITSYSWGKDYSVTTDADNIMIDRYYLLNLGLEIYMCEKESE